MRKLHDAGIKVGSPAVAADQSWLQQFFKSCGSDCPVDFLAVGPDSDFMCR